MNCLKITNKRFWLLLLAAGVVSLAFGIISVLREPEVTGSSAMLLGMFTGLGAAFTVISIIRLIYMAVAPAAKIKQAEINVKDERNVQILRASYTVANTAASLLFAVMAFVFVGLGYRVPGLIAAGALWVQVLVFLISHRVLSKKM
jgi:hypothetical protein